MTALHPDDRATIDRIHGRIVALRRQYGHGVNAVAEHLGISHSAVTQWTRGNGAANPRLPTLQMHARTIGHQLRAVPHGLPALPDNRTVANLRAMAAAEPDPTLADAYHRAAVLAWLVSVRRWSGATCASVGAHMGCSDKAVSRIESGEKEPYATTWMRYVRALGGRLDLELEPVVDVAELAAA